MHSKVSIPAWVNPPIVVGAFIAVLIAVAVVVYREHSARVCTVLIANIDQVQRGEAQTRMSDTHRDFRSGRRRFGARKGDFPLISIDATRACLGESWTEAHLPPQGEVRAEVWTFVRPGGPVVLYSQSRGSESTPGERRIAIERISQ